MSAVCRGRRVVSSSAARTATAHWPIPESCPVPNALSFVQVRPRPFRAAQEDLQTQSLQIWTVAVGCQGRLDLKEAVGFERKRRPSLASLR